MIPNSRPTTASGFDAKDISNDKASVNTCKLVSPEFLKSCQSSNRSLFPLVQVSFLMHYLMPTSVSVPKGSFMR
jgi:hypothetical protein